MNVKENSILIVDDEIEITKSIVRQFRRTYNVFTATSADEAFPILENNEIQIVISDQRMPGLTGVDFFSQIKEKYPDTIRIILTGYSDIDAVVGAINNGHIFRYMTKPWNPVDLDSVIKEAFEKHELVRTNKYLVSTLKSTNEMLEEKVKERTAALEKSNKILTDINYEKNKYIGIVAHDLRNPIGIAQSFSRLLIEEHDEIPKSKQLNFLGIINDRCTFALNLMTDILDITKIESGVLGLNLEKCDFINLAKQIVWQNSVFANKKNQILTLNTELEQAEFFFDCNKIEQVLNNLLNNAIKYSKVNKKIELRIEKDNEFLVCSVVDQGVGIKESEIMSIFKPYRTASVNGTNNEKSIGLGLAIVKKIVEAHSGTISVDSRLNEGSTFAFTLPIKLQ